MMERFRVLPLAFQKGVHVKKNVLTLRGVTELVQTDVGAAGHKRTVLTIREEAFGRCHGLIYFALEEGHEVSKPGNRLLDERCHQIPIILAATDDRQVFRTIKLDGIAIERE